jgi:hypothetical protein
VVLDPNADFWKCYLVEEADLWAKASYDLGRRLGRLPHERNRTDFVRAWSQIDTRILTARSLEPGLEKPYAPLQVWLPSLSVETFAEGLNPVERSEVYQCHVFVRAVSLLFAGTTKKRENLIDRLERLFELGKRDRAALRLTIQDEVAADPSRRFLVNTRTRRALAALPYISPEMGRYYFARAKEYQAAHILAAERQRPIEPSV